MSIFEEYQTTEISELFNVEVTKQALEQISEDRLTPQEQAILNFIVDNPNEQYIELQKTFNTPDHIVMSLVLEYGTPSDEYEELKELRDELLSKSI